MNEPNFELHDDLGPAPDEVEQVAEAADNGEAVQA